MPYGKGMEPYDRWNKDYLQWTYRRDVKCPHLHWTGEKIVCLSPLRLVMEAVLVLFTVGRIILHGGLGWLGLLDIVFIMAVRFKISRN